MALLNDLPSHRLDEEEENVLPPGVGELHQVGLVDELLEDGQARRLVSAHRGLALALLPAVAVGRGSRVLQLAVVTLVANPGALGAAAQGVGQAAGAALENVLVESQLWSLPQFDLLSHLQSRSSFCFWHTIEDAFSEVRLRVLEGCRVS